MNLVLYPFGGLANRLRVLLSGLALAEIYGLKTKIYWIERDELKCPYYSLLKQIEGVEVVSTTTNSFWKFVMGYGRRAYFSPSILGHTIITDKFIRQNFETGYFDIKGEEFEKYFVEVKSKNNIIITCGKFFNYGNDQLQKLMPADAVSEITDSFIKENELDKYVAYHIRYTDNQLSMDNSPLHLFERSIEDQIAKGQKIVICTDSTFITERFSKIYGSQLLYPPAVKDRLSEKGMQSAFAELILLSKAEVIYGSYGSTFSLTASEIGCNALHLITQ